MDKKYFSWFDCWVITGIFLTHTEGSEIDLSMIIEGGDYISHSIYTEKELKNGFYKAQKKGLISISNNKITISDRGRMIWDKASVRGPILAVVGRLEEELNSRKTELMNINDEAIDPCGFINKKTLKENYEKYKQRHRRKK